MKKKVVNTVFVVVVIAGLLLGTHLLIHNFALLDVLKKMHGG